MQRFRRQTWNKTTRNSSVSIVRLGCGLAIEGSCFVFRQGSRPAVRSTQAFLIGSRAFIRTVKPSGRAFSTHLRLVPSLKMSGAIPPLPIWFEEGQLKFNILRELKTSLGRFKSKWEDNIKMDIKEIGWDSVDWLLLTRARDQCRSILKIWVNCWFP